MLKRAPRKEKEILLGVGGPASEGTWSLTPSDTAGLLSSQYVRLYLVIKTENKSEKDLTDSSACNPNASPALKSLWN